MSSQEGRRYRGNGLRLRTRGVGRKKKQREVEEREEERGYWKSVRNNGVLGKGKHPRESESLCKGWMNTGRDKRIAVARTELVRWCGMDSNERIVESGGGGGRRGRAGGWVMGGSKSQRSSGRGEGVWARLVEERIERTVVEADQGEPFYSQIRVIFPFVYLFTCFLVHVS